MATMKDIAKLAGVSQGTVSNVLNNRGNVSVEKIKLVMEAAEEVNYVINAPARQLRSSSGLSSNIAVILPNVMQARYATFFTAVQKFFQERDYRVLLFVTDDFPYIEKKALNTINTLRACGVISITSLPNALEEYRSLESWGCKIIFVEQDPQGPFFYMGYDYENAGRAVAEKIIEKKFNKVGLLTGIGYFTSEAGFKNGFMKTIRKSFKSIEVRSVNSYYTTELNAVLDLIDLCHEPEVIVTTGKDGFDAIIQAYNSVIKKELPPVLAVAPVKHSNLQGSFTQYILDYSQLGREASLKMAGLLEKPEENQSAPQRIILEERGWQPQESFPAVKIPNTTLNILLASNQSAGAIMKMAPAFTKMTGVDLKFVAPSLEEVTEYLCKEPNEGYFDVVRTNLTTTPSFPPGTLSAFDKETFHTLTSTMFDNIVTDFSYKDGVPSAIPFDISVHFLAYRTDLFSDPIIQRSFFEKYGQELQLPRDYDEYNLISKFFTKSVNPESPVEFGTTSVLGDDALLFTDFLLRYKNLGGKIGGDENGLRFDYDLAQRAIENYYEMLSFSIQSKYSKRRDTGIINFAEGKTLMEHISTSYAPGILDLKKNFIGGRIGYGYLLGRSTYVGGGALAVPKASSNKEAAKAFIEWACGLSQSNLFTLLGGTSPHKSIYTDSQILQIYPWFNLMVRSVSNSSSAAELNSFHRYRLERMMGATLRRIYYGALDLKSGGREIEKIFFSCYKGAL